MAAYNPEPHRASEAQGFVGANPAAKGGATAHGLAADNAGIYGAKGGAIPRVSPGLAAGNVNSAANMEEARAKAEKMVNAEREARGRLPVYEGLPSQFQLELKMGDGAFSNVYKALDKRTNKNVAIKCVRKFELNHSQRANILKEVQIMRGLDHPGIVQLVSFTESSLHYFLVLELMEGGELFHQIVKLTYFSEDLARHVILQVAHGIHYLHEVKGVVHRDIKPENLLFDGIPIIPSVHPKARPYDEEKEDEGEFIPGFGGGGIGRVKIADFGLSKIVWNEDTMTPCGTVGYTAPEIVKDERYSKSVDMWALGCVLYTLLCGFPPFYDESINVLTEKVARGYYTFLSPWWDDISASSKDLITNLLTVDPDKRYTIDEFLAHPWCNQKPAPPNIDARTLAAITSGQPVSLPQAKTVPRHQVPPNNIPMDSPMLADQQRIRRDPGQTPGGGMMREAFDITYAVHRMGEEGQRRGAGGRGFLNDLNEADEEEEDEAEIERTRKKYGASVSKVIEDQRAAAQAAAAAGQQQQGSNAAYHGWGGANRKEAEAVLYDGRAGNRDRGRKGNGRGGGFDLKLDNATLLGRRGAKNPAAGLSLGGNPAFAAPSPMRVD